MNKKIYPFFLVVAGLAGGIVISYFIWGKNDVKTENVEFSLSKGQIDSTLKINFDTLSSRGKRLGTRIIPIDTAIIFRDDFLSNLKFSPPSSTTSKWITWPDDLHGWIIDAVKVKTFLLDQQGQITDLKKVTHILVELGIDKDENGKNDRTTLIFTGVERQSDGTYRRIHLKSDTLFKPYIVPGRSPEDNILEFVDPCKTCP